MYCLQPGAIPDCGQIKYDSNGINPGVLIDQVASRGEQMDENCKSVTPPGMTDHHDTPVTLSASGHLPAEYQPATSRNQMLRDLFQRARFHRRAPAVHWEYLSAHR